MKSLRAMSFTCCFFVPSKSHCFREMMPVILFSYDLRILQQDLLTYSVALESILDKWPILFLESVHRLVVILYETLAVWGMVGRGQTIGEYQLDTFFFFIIDK